MGIDLVLLPFDCDHENLAFSHSILCCTRRIDLFQELMELPSTKVPAGFTSYLSREGEYEESHYGVTETTPYSDPLMFVNAGILASFHKHRDIIDNNKNRAVWAYLRELPYETKVALYWH